MKYIRYLLLLLLPACNISKTIVQTDPTRMLMSDSNKQVITGTFKNVSLPHASDKELTLWNSLTSKEKSKDLWQNGTVNIHLTPKHRVKATLYYDDKIVDTKSLRFKIEDNFIVLRRQLNFKWPLGPLLWIYINNKVRLAVNEQNQLCLINNKSKFGFLVLLPVASGDFGGNFFYDRIPSN